MSQPGRGMEYPLTEVQMAYFVGRGEAGVSTRLLYELRSRKSVAAMERAMNCIIREQAALQLVFTESGTQKLLPEVPEYHIPVEDLRALSPEQAEKEVLRQFRRASKENYDPYNWPLFSLKAFLVPGDDRVVYHMGIDMLIADGMSLRLIIRKLGEYASSGKAPGSMDTGFLTYCRDKQDTDSEEYRKARAYWLKKADTFPEAPSFAPRRQASSKKRFGRKDYEAKPEKWAKIREQIRARGLNVSSFLMGVYAMVVGLYSGQKEFALDLPVFDRIGQPRHDTIGDYTSILLLPVSMEQTDFKGFCRQLQMKSIEAFMHREYSGLSFMRELARLKGEADAIYPVVFTSMINEQQDMAVSEEDDITRGYSQTSQVILDCQAVVNHEEMHIIWDYDPDAFPEGLVDRMFSRFTEILESEGEIRMEISEEERAAWEGYEEKGQGPVPEPGLLGQALRGIAETVPNRRFLAAGGRTWTYGETEACVEKLTAWLLGKGVKRGDGVMLPALKTPEYIALILAVLRAGAYYIPYAPDVPEGRKASMKELSGAAWDIGPGELKQGLTFPGAVKEAPCAAEPGDLAYVIFTSGSTGTPKGVMVTHAEAWNTIQDINRRFSVTGGDCILGISELTFDLSVYDIFGAIEAGASLVCTADHHHFGEIRRLMTEYRVTVWNSVPALFSLLLETDREPVPYYLDRFGEAGTVRREKPDDYLSLRLVLLSGDYIPVTLPDRIRSAYPNSRVVSLGGATEGAVWSIFYPIGQVDPEWNTIPYGYPLSGQTMYVLDWRGDPCAPGVAGEIAIGGAGVAEGYAGSPELTGKSFADHPYLGRIYRTGDLGMLSEDGVIMFLGRKDHQVKIHGYRVELEEINQKVESFPGVQQAVTFVSPQNRNTLVSCYTSARDVDTEELKEYLSGELLSYMVPSVLLPLPELPLTGNGKLDRKKMAALISARGQERAGLPSTEEEKEIHGLFCRVLERESCGIHEDFFDLGGDSMKGIILFNLLEESFEVNLNQIFRHRTIAELAKELKRKEGKGDRFRDLWDQIMFADEADPETEGHLKKLYEGYRARTDEKVRETAAREERPGAILLTGATGFLGGYLLREFILHSPAKIHLLVRGKDPGQRLEKHLSFLFGDEPWIRECRGRVAIWNGDLTEEFLGLGEEREEALFRSVDCVVHCAAKVAHYGRPEDFQRTNVDSTRKLLEGCLKYGAEFHLISSTRVLDSREERDCVLYSEETSPAECAGNEAYTDSKIRSESLVEEYRLMGVKASIYRVGTVVFDSDNGIFQENASENAFYSILGTFFRLGFFPSIESKILDLSYVNEAAGAVAALILKSGARNETWHIYNPNKISETEFYRMLKEAGCRRSLELLDMDGIMEKMEDAGEEAQRDMDLVMIHAASYISMGGDLAVTVNDRTVMELEKLGFSWSVPDVPLVRKMLEYGERAALWGE